MNRRMPAKEVGRGPLGREKSRCKGTAARMDGESQKHDERSSHGSLEQPRGARRSCVLRYGIHSWSLSFLVLWPKQSHLAFLSLSFFLYYNGDGLFWFFNNMKIIYYTVGFCVIKKMLCPLCHGKQGSCSSPFYHWLIASRKPRLTIYLII